MSQRACTFVPGGKNRTRMNYLLYTPPGEVTSGKGWPLILFLHGAGERGDDPEILKRHSIPKIVETQPDFPFVTLSPQCDAGTTWEDHLETLRMFLDDALRRIPVDANRVYLTGISMGGHGVWLLATEYADRFAALAPICGFGGASSGFPQRVCILRNVPVWVFHGAKDDVIPVRESEILVETLKGCGGNVRFTIYPDAGHDSWTPTYNNPELYEWFLKHRLDRPVGTTGKPSAPPANA